MEVSSNSLSKIDKKWACPATHKFQHIHFDSLSFSREGRVAFSLQNLEHCREEGGKDSVETFPSGCLGLWYFRVLSPRGTLYPGTNSQHLSAYLPHSWGEFFNCP